MRNKTSVAPIGRVVTLIILVVGLVVMSRMAFGWSLSETKEFMDIGFGIQWGLTASIMVQVGPNAALVMNKMYRNSPWVFWVTLGLAVVLNTIDWGSNWFAFYFSYDAGVAEQLGRVYTLGIRPFGYLMGFMVTWFEEGLAFILASILQTSADLLEDLGVGPGRFLFLDEAAEYAASASGRDVLPRGGAWRGMERDGGRPSRGRQSED